MMGGYNPLKQNSAGVSIPLRMERVRPRVVDSNR